MAEATPKKKADITKTATSKIEVEKNDKPVGLMQKLLYIQRSVLGLGKDTNGAGYRYVSGEKVLDHIRPLMCELGLMLMPEIKGITNVRQNYHVGTPPREKSEILVTLEMVYTWIDVDSMEERSYEWKTNGQNGWDKGVGSAATYSERYFLLKFFHIKTDKDDVDAINREEQTDAPNVSNPETQKVPEITQIEKDLRAERSIEKLDLYFSKLAENDRQNYWDIYNRIRSFRLSESKKQATATA